MAISTTSNVAGLQSHPAPISKGDVVVMEGYYASGDDGGGEMYFEGTPPPASAQIADAVAAVTAVNGATNTAPIVINTGQPHGFATGQSVLISGVNGNAAANGTWIVTVASSTQFSLDGSFGSAAYVNGGFASSVIVTAGAPHGLEAGGQVMIARVAWTSGAGINGLWKYVGMLDATRFSIGARTTGTWSAGGIFGDGGVSFPSTAVNGRWLRSVTHPLNVRWWGAKGDGITDDYPTFAATLAYIDAQLGIQNFPSAVAVFVPQGQYRLAKTLFLDRPIDLFGEGRSASVLLFKTTLPAGAPIDGIVLQRHSNMPATPPFYDASAARVRRLGIFGDGNSYVLSQAPYPLFQEFDPLTSGPVSTGHGYVAGNGVVVLTHNGTVEDCAIGGFRFDAVHVEAIASSDGTHDSDNANEWSVRDCQLVDCGRHGLFVSGGENTNAGYAQGLDVLGNSGWGIYDRSFFGNAYHGCGTERNGVFIRDVLALVVDTGYLAGRTGVTYGLFAGSKQGGTYVSADSAASWSSHNIGLQNILDTTGDNATRLCAITCLATDGATVYAGSGAVNAGIRGGGVFRIQPAFTDEWSPWSQGLSSTDIRALAVGNNVVLAGSAGGGIFKSSDGGVHWAASNVNLTTLDVRALVYDTDHPGTFYAGTNGGGVFKSTDSGASWTAVNSGLASTSVLSMAVAAGVMYAGAADGTIYQSTSGGASWALAFTESGGHAIQALAVGAQSPSKIYAATRGAGVYVSVDSGANWAPRNNGLLDPEQSQPIQDIRAAAVAPDGRVYVGVIGNHYNVDHHNNGGVFASADDGVSWTSVGAGLSYGGGYLSVGGLAPNTFVGCYAEGGQNNWIIPPSIVVGGILATEMTPPPPGFSTQVISSRGIFGIPHMGSVVQSVRQITAAQAMFVQNTSATDRFVLVDAPGNRSAVLVLNPPGTVGGQLLTIQKTNASDYPVHVQGALEGGLGALDLLLPFATVTLLAAGPEWKIVDWKNFNRASVNEFADPTTVAYPVFGYIPAYAGNYLVGVYYRVVGGATDVKLVLQWGDVVGTQQQTLVNVTGQPVGSYGVAPAIVNCVVGGEIIVYATASVADRLIVSTTAERLA